MRFIFTLWASLVSKAHIEAQAMKTMTLSYELSTLMTMYLVWQWELPYYIGNVTSIFGKLTKGNCNKYSSSTNKCLISENI